MSINNLIDEMIHYEQKIIMININSKVYIAGHNGMLGSSILRKLKKKGYKKIITIDKKDLDLRNQNAVRKFLKAKKPDVVIIAAAKVGGIKANIKFPANFISDNLQIQTNLISLSHENNIKLKNNKKLGKVKKLKFLSFKKKIEYKFNQIEL